MSLPPCVFCAIVRGSIPSVTVYQNEHVTVIKDIAPKAPVHLLIVSRVHVPDVASLQADHSDVAAAMLMVTSQLQNQLTGSRSFRLITNTGIDAGQSVFHLHFHFLSGKSFQD